MIRREEAGVKRIFVRERNAICRRKRKPADYAGYNPSIGLEFFLRQASARLAGADCK